MKAEKRIQLNLLLQQCKYLPEIERIPNVMLPIFYGSEEGSISPELANDFKSAVYTVKYGVTGGIWAAIGLAGQAHFNLATIKSPSLSACQHWAKRQRFYLWGYNDTIEELR